MDMKALLEKMTQFAGQAVGQTPGDQVRGTEKAKKGTKEHPFKGRLVGDSQDNMLRGLSKLAEEKTEEWALAEAYQQFLEAQLEEDDLGVEPKRPGRKSDRPGREYTKHGQPSKRYTYQQDDVKEDDSELSPQEFDSRRREAFSAHDDATADYGIASIGMRAKKTRPVDDDDLDEGKVVPVITAFRKGMQKIAASNASSEEKQTAFEKLSAEFHRNAEAYAQAVKAKRKVDETTPVATAQTTMAAKTQAANPAAAAPAGGVVQQTGTAPAAQTQQQLQQPAVQPATGAVPPATAQTQQQLQQGAVKKPSGY